MSRSITDRWGVGAALVAFVALVMLLAGQGSAPAATGDGRGEGADGRGGAGAHASIVGGRIASIAAYPWLANIEYRGPVEELGCGGSVIAPRLVLTAAHCVLTGTGRVGVAANFSVRTGISDLDEASPERTSRVSQVLVFPDYNPARVLNDIGLLVLSAPVSVPSLPIATAADATLLAAGTPLAVAGWGLTSVEPPRVPSRLREAQPVVQETAECERRLRRVLTSYAPASQFCVQTTSAPEASLCNGDSGGPGIARRADGSVVQVGVISLKGSLDCSPRSPQVLARVDRASAWIAAWIAAVEHGAPPPAVVVPPVTLPPVTRNDAEIVIWLGLEADFRSRFSEGRDHRFACRRLDRTKVKCVIQWLRGPHLYRGGITVYTALPREGSVYNYRYKIRRFDTDCWLTYKHPIQACGPRVFRR